MAIEMKLKYKISDDEVVVYSSRAWFLFVAGFGIVAVTTYAVIFVMLYTLNGKLDLKSLGYAATLLIFLPFYLAGNRQVIFSRKDEAVYRSYGFGKRMLCRFADIRRIELRGGSTPSYRICLKSDTYGKGINLLTPATPKMLWDLEKNVLPALTKMLPIPEDTPEYAIDLDSLKYYSREGNIFTLGRRFEIAWSIFLLCLGAGFIIAGVNPWLPCPMILIALGWLTLTIRLNTENRTLTRSLLFFKKTYRFEQLIRFNIVRKTMNGMYNGTDINLIFLNDKGKETEMKLRNIHKTAKMELLLAETRAIMRIV